ncbi:LemA protein [Nitrosomonas nitrosa]|jgi:LemA protein|uniref:LemA protein n=1 Tax=Nitrosomonas nitrosa TaxID=52442 RepID=A0A1I4LXJ8_9PROT|nr:LemA family protein [Nitrosomonas nitrosa]MCO6433117.1 LemA family protein [Nitrosomonas nitrosa]PTR02827.1 LemA protein [Nitrosomonas nitrosa]SFL95918.1 LemA protein [Nitrosomonas nitrosa]
MDIVIYIFLIATIIVSVYSILIYNSLVDLKHSVSQAWSNIDILLKQRHDELPKLVETCKQYMGFEQEALKQIISARARVAQAREAGDIGALGLAENMLRTGLGNLFAVVEDYPELKASEKFQHLQARITQLENSIADRREYYNEAAKINNVRIEQFPDVIIANWFRFKPRTLLEFSDADKQDVDMRKLFS